jgi:hypothetical protein
MKTCGGVQEYRLASRISRSATGGIASSVNLIGGWVSRRGPLHALEKKKCLAPAVNQTVNPATSSPWPSHFTNCAV